MDERWKADQLAAMRALVEKARSQQRFVALAGETDSEQLWMSPNELQEILDRGELPHNSGHGCFLLVDPILRARLLAADKDAAQKRHDAHLRRLIDAFGAWRDQ